MRQPQILQICWLELLCVYSGKGVGRRRLFYTEWLIIWMQLKVDDSFCSS
jgi:hypothetical protein